MSLIVGISAHYHDAACCIIRDGKLIAAAQEERFSRIKHDLGIPAKAFRYCLSEAKATIRDIDAIAYYENPHKKAARQLWAAWPHALGDPAIRFRIDPKRPEAEIRRYLGFEGPIDFFDHHLSHAASAYLYSGFTEAAIFVADGVGEWTTTSYATGTGENLDIFEDVSFPHSLGLLYSAITSYLGFEVNDGEYKVMGLAPYGRPVYRDQIRQLLKLTSDGSYVLTPEYFDFAHDGCMYSEKMESLLGQRPREPESKITEFHADLSSSLQAVLEDVLISKIKYLHDKIPVESLCLAGGVALNCVANARIRRTGYFKKMFVQPAAGDAGGALGAAALSLVQRTGHRPGSEALHSVFLGPSYSNREIARLVYSTPLGTSAVDFAGDSDKLVQCVARLLAQGKVVGWFQGRMEFGPRALGSRSILADPRPPEIRDRVNELVKLRERFRPFAPAVPESKMCEHFAMESPSPFMLETFQVVSPLSMPAITHVDGSARVQTVNPTWNPRFHALLLEFERVTGCPILLNTSFNLRGEPIVLDPLDAFWTFAVSGLDVLVLEDTVVERSTGTDAWGGIAEMLRAHRTKRDAIAGANVYTFI